MENLTRWKIKKLEGKCYCCNLPVIEGKSYCYEHLSVKKARNKLRRSKVCDGCGGLREKGGFCTICWAKRIKRQKKRKQEKTSRGECITCNNKNKEGSVRCEKCLGKSKKLRINRENFRRENHLCFHCGLPTGNTKLCKMCYAKSISSDHFKTTKRANELIEILDKQNSICPYSGKYLAIGENCSLDHIIPKSRGGTDEKENLQWVYRGEIDLNWMKGDLTDDEFRKSIHLIYEYLLRGK